MNAAFSKAVKAVESIQRFFETDGTSSNAVCESFCKKGDSVDCLATSCEDKVSRPTLAVDLPFPRDALQQTPEVSGAQKSQKVGKSVFFDGDDHTTPSPTVLKNVVLNDGWHDYISVVSSKQPQSLSQSGSNTSEHSKANSAVSPQLFRLSSRERFGSHTTYASKKEVTDTSLVKTAPCREQHCCSGSDNSHQSSPGQQRKSFRNSTYRWEGDYDANEEVAAPDLQQAGSAKEIFKRESMEYILTKDSMSNPYPRISKEKSTRPCRVIDCCSESDPSISLEGPHDKEALYQRNAEEVAERERGVNVDADHSFTGFFKVSPMEFGFPQSSTSGHKSQQIEDAPLSPKQRQSKSILKPAQSPNQRVTNHWQDVERISLPPQSQRDTLVSKMPKTSHYSNSQNYALNTSVREKEPSTVAKQRSSYHTSMLKPADAFSKNSTLTSGKEVPAESQVTLKTHSISENKIRKSRRQPGLRHEHTLWDHREEETNRASTLQTPKSKYAFSSKESLTSRASRSLSRFRSRSRRSSKSSLGSFLEEDLRALREFPVEDQIRANKTTGLSKARPSRMHQLKSIFELQKFTTSRSAQCVSELYPGEDLRRKCGEGCKLLKSRQSDEVLSQASKSDPSDSGSNIREVSMGDRLILILLCVNILFLLGACAAAAYLVMTYWQIKQLNDETQQLIEEFDLKYSGSPVTLG